jgi:hypothetical protein
MTVEECAVLDIRDCTHKGVFALGFGIWHEFQLTGFGPETPTKMPFVLQKTATGTEMSVFPFLCSKCPFVATALSRNDPLVPR